MFFLRLGIPERSHLIEYSVLAIFIHKAFAERVSQGNKIAMPALLSFAVTFLIGVLDECIQLFLPNRVFDALDILFNGIAVTLAIGSNVFLVWVRKRITEHKLKRE
jgi:VanZ family protein